MSTSTVTDLSFVVSRDLEFPYDAAHEVLAFVAKRGGGKTYNASKLAEAMLKAGVPIVVLDPMSVWWGLRVASDGKGPGLPVVVFGGEHADLPLSVENAKEIARAIVDTNISCVLDLGEMSHGEARKVLVEFVPELQRLNRVDRHIFIEEADVFASQKPYGDQSVCLGVMDNLVRRGGNHNLGCTLITQRSAVLNKDVLTQADYLVVLRTLAPQDKAAIQEWVKNAAEEDNKELKKWYDSLKSLENGEAWVWHPETPVIFKKVKFAPKDTFHATRENLKGPRAGSIEMMPVPDFIARFRDALAIQTVCTHSVSTDDLKKRLERESKLRDNMTFLEAHVKGMAKDRDELKGKLDLATKANDILEKRALELAEENSKLKKALPFLEALSGMVDDRVKHWQGKLAIPQAASGVEQGLTLVHMKTKLHLKEESRTLPEVSTLTPKGKIVRLIKEGKLDSPHVVSDIVDMAPGLDRLNALNALKTLAAEQVLLEGKADDRRITYQKSPDVEVETA